jgi:DHA2 family multidrug resistance protein-like MFS transporter
VFSLGLGPVFILATDLIVGTAPAERAGAASAISETGAELGGALGIALLGSVGTAVYRSGVTDAFGEAVPEAARDTLGGALAVAEQLPADAGRELMAVAHDAFTQGLHLSATVGAAVAVGVALLVATLLRNVRASGHEDVTPSTEDAEVGGSAFLQPACAES